MKESARLKNDIANIKEETDIAKEQSNIALLKKFEEVNVPRLTK